MQHIVKVRQLKHDDLLAQPAYIDQNSHWKAVRPQVGEGGTRKGPGLPPLKY